MTHDNTSNRLEDQWDHERGEIQPIEPPPSDGHFGYLKGILESEKMMSKPYRRMIERREAIKNALRLEEIKRERALVKEVEENKDRERKVRAETQAQAEAYSHASKNLAALEAYAYEDTPRGNTEYAIADIKRASNLGSDISALLEKVTPDLARQLVRKEISDSINFMRYAIKDPDIITYDLTHSLMNYYEQALAFNIQVSDLISRGDLHELTNTFEEIYSTQREKIKPPPSKFIQEVCELAFNKKFV